MVEGATTKFDDLNDLGSDSGDKTDDDNDADEDKNGNVIVA